MNYYTFKADQHTFHFDTFEKLMDFLKEINKSLNNLITIKKFENDLCIYKSHFKYNGFYYALIN